MTLDLSSIKDKSSVNDDIFQEWESMVLKEEQVNQIIYAALRGEIVGLLTSKKGLALKITKYDGFYSFSFGRVHKTDDGGGVWVRPNSYYKKPSFQKKKVEGPKNETISAIQKGVNVEW